jgi:hypothetical protein
MEMSGVTELFRQEVQLVYVFHGNYVRGALQWEATAVEEMRSLSGDLRLVADRAAHPVSVRVLSPAQASREGCEWNEDRRGADCRLVVLQADVPFDPRRVMQEQESLGPNGSQVPVRELARYHIESDLVKRAGDILLAMALAVPGGAPGEVQVRIDGKLVFRQLLRGGHVREARAAQPPDSPPLSELPLTQCLRWLSGLPGFDRGVPRGPTGHAVAALSRILGLETATDLVVLTWCMVGLEALYVRGHDAITAQFRENISGRFGATCVPKAAVSALYDHRSRFLHGSSKLPIPLAYSPYEGEHDYETSSESAYASANLAVCLLVASLQSMVQDDICELAHAGTQPG